MAEGGGEVEERGGGGGVGRRDSELVLISRYNFKFLHLTLLFSIFIKN